MLSVMIAVDEFADTIKAQFNSYDLLEVANESSIRLCLFAIDNNRRAIHLRMAGRIGTGLGSLSTPMFDDLAVLEAKEVKRYDRPRKAGPAFVFRMKHDDVAVHNRTIYRNVRRRRIRQLRNKGPQAGQSVPNVRIVLHERLGKEAVNGTRISISKNRDCSLPRSRTQVGSIR